MGALSDVLSAVKAAALSQVAARPIRAPLAAAVCSITFDDVPRSAFEHGVPILRRFGATATFYVSAGMQASDGFLGAEDIRTLVAEGFDVASHTYSHYSLYAGTADGLGADCDRNRAAFTDELRIPAPRDFSYPFGEVTIRAKRSMGRRFATARSVYRGLNGVGSDLLLLRANALYSSTIDWDRTRRLLAAAVRRRAWIIFYTHGVDAHPDRWSCTPADLTRLLQEVTDAAVPIRSVRSVSEELHPQWDPAAPGSVR